MKMQMIQVPDVLKSKRFVSSIVAAILATLVVIVPEFQAQEAALLDMVVLLFGLLIGGYSIQDALQVHKTGITKYDRVANE